MISVGIEEYRCKNCKKLLFKGALGMGIVEVKCERCGNVSLLHSFDRLMRSKPGGYIVVFGSDGHIIAASKSVKSLLGREFDRSDSILALDPTVNLGGLPEIVTQEALNKWEDTHRDLPSETTHHKGDGGQVAVTARYYPVISYSDVYTVGVFYLKDNTVSLDKLAISGIIYT